jgi:SAM-dependent methyltransferase
VTSDRRVWTATPRPPVRIPQRAVAAYDAFLVERFPRASRERLLFEVEELSEAFTAEREDIPGSYLNQPPRRSAYLAYFHPQQVLRGMAAIEETRARAGARGLWPTSFSATERPRVLDLGAGLGAMSQALLLDGARPAEITLVDHQKSALTDARDLTVAVFDAVAGKAVDEGGPPRVRTANERLGAWLARAVGAGWRYDLVLLGGVLNEIRADWAPLLERAVRLLDPAAPGGGVVVIVEPALPPTARKLMELRESALPSTTTIAPCTHGAACPLLALRKDWCFTVRAAELPPRVASFARKLGHQTDETRFAQWSFAARAEAAPFEVDVTRHARVVSDRMEGERVLCVDGRRERTSQPGLMVRGDLARS